MRILCIGMSHKTADVALRERLALEAPAAGRALRQLVERWEEAEFVLLSTCNRTEIYAARPVHGHPRQEELLAWLGRFCGVDERRLDGATFCVADAAAIHHLLAVASGLDSLVVGEAQVAAQVKEAYAAAREAGTARSVMAELFEGALHAAKSVHTETEIGEGRTSVASAAVDCALDAVGGLDGKSVLNVGAGEMNELMLRHLRDCGSTRLVVTNRSFERAEALAIAFGGQAAPFAELGERLAEADVVLTSTAADLPIITRKMVAAAQGRRDGRPLLIIDIAVPRDVESGVSELDGVRLYNIDDLERIVAASLQGRHRQLVAAEAVVARHLARLTRRLRVREVAPTIADLQELLEGIAQEELAAARNKLSEHDDAELDTQVLQRALHRTIRRVLDPVARNLRREAGSDAAGAHIAALRKLFGLDK